MYGARLGDLYQLYGNIHKLDRLKTNNDSNNTISCLSVVIKSCNDIIGVQINRIGIFWLNIAH